MTICLAEIEDTLPDTMSGLIRVALRDLRVAEKTPGVVVDMEYWHRPENGKCYECLAGAVMAGLGVPTTTRATPIWFSERLPYKFYAIDSLRGGSVKLAAIELDMNLPEGTPADVWIPDYHIDRTGFYAALEKLATDLEARGL